MKAVACQVRCECGGAVQSLLEDDVFYIVTENDTIIFQGVCGNCRESVRVERPIVSLFGLCPTENRRTH